MPVLPLPGSEQTEEPSNYEEPMDEIPNTGMIQANSLAKAEKKNGKANGRGNENGKGNGNGNKNK
ncbi:hypothetical protein D1872_280900 [compost metagenome]